MSKTIPKHIGIILDGNRRWAKKRNLPTFEGHRRGFLNVKKIASYAYQQGVEILTLYAFSTENWQRNKSEVAYLMKLFKLFVTREVDEIAKQGIKVNIFGRPQDFDTEMRKYIKQAEVKTKHNKKGILNVCLSYGGRDEIVRAVNKALKNKNIRHITQSEISKHLDSAGLPDPDLIIRTSGEQRLSNFLTWQSVYSELYFPKKHWPGFDKHDFDQAIEEYGRRQRRFGGN